MNIQKSTHTAVVTLHIDLEYFAIAENMCVYRILSYMPSTPGQPVPGLALNALVTTLDRQGFATLSNLQAYQAGVVGKLEAAVGVYLFPPAVIDEVRTQGFPRAIEAAAKKNGTHFGAEPLPYDVLSRNPSRVTDVYRVDYSSHMMFRLDNSSVPNAVHFSYSSGGLCNSRFDLAKACAILEKDPRVRFLATPPIQAIPGYNQCEDRTAEIPLVFSPTDADEQALWAQQQAYGATYPSTRRFEAMYDLDILGLAAGGAAHTDN